MDNRTTENSNTAAFLAGGGEMGALMRAKDWSRTPVGPVDTWPRSLRTVVQIMLGSRYAMWMGWGSERTFFYNDAYRPTLGGKHPWALGSPAAEVWAEIWPAIGPRVEIVEQRGEATWDEGLLLFLERHGYPEETYHTFSYSPLPDDDGGIGGMLCVVTEETERVIGERRLRILREIAARVAATRTPEEVFKAVADHLERDKHDLPLTLTYVWEGESDRARLVASTGLTPGHRAAPAAIGAEDDTPWPVAAMLARLAPVTIGELAVPYDAWPTAPWEEPPRLAIALPIAQQGQQRPAGFFIAGLNPHRPFDDNYRGFLGLLVGQIAAGLANARAYEAERRRAEMLAELDRAKTAFFSNASHEFRTPLTLMLGPLEDLLVGAASSEIVLAQRREIELIHRNGLRLLKLVNTLLDFSRIEAGRVQSNFEPVDLAAYTAELASTFRAAMDKAGLRYVVDCPSSPLTAYVDRDMWEKIVLNLISNGFKYTFQGEVAVSLRPTQDRQAVELVVGDTGEGIPAHEVPRLFERFHRVQGQRGRTQEGSGIGLALVHELVKIHGGAVRVESVLNGGTTFTVAMPLGRAHLPAERIGAARAAPSFSLRAEAFVEEAMRWLPGEAGSSEVAIAKQSIGPEPVPPSASERSLVLLADDNADMRDYVRRLLAERYEVAAVADGQAALDMARRRRPDLVLSDVMMPRLDGFGLLQALRADPDLREVPIVLLSARAGEEAKIEGLEFGADDYLVKPFGARELVARVAANLELARIRRKSAEALRDEAHTLETLNRTGVALAAELDLERLIQTITDAGVELTGAQFGAFFYKAPDEQGEADMLCALSGISRDAFAAFPMPRRPESFEPTFRGAGVVRSDDIGSDPRYRLAAPYLGMPPGGIRVRSYLAVPIATRSGEVLGGLFFGHPEPGIFSGRTERLVAGIAAQAAVAIDNARLYQASQREIEARKRVEQDLHHLNQTLEQRVSSEIAARMKVEEALRQAQKMEAVGQLTGGIAHDFNNLLTVIQGNLETIQRRIGDASPQLGRAIEGGLRGTERAATLTHRLLAFSRRQPLDPKPLALNKLVAGMSDLLRRTLGEAITIESVLAGDLWWTAADSNQLESALLNLAVNARDAMKDGGRLTIETANTVLDDSRAGRQDEATPGEYVMLAVSDTGSGMPKNVVDRAFEPFFTTKEVGQGTGLGLSQIYGFVTQSGGQVRIQSEPGQGTTVKLYLPRLLGSQAVDDDGMAQPAQPTAGKGETILVVEDDDDVRAHSAGILRELGYRVLSASDGLTALRLLKDRSDIELLFTDVGLAGGLDGRQLGDEARRRHPTLKVLFTTGYARNAFDPQGQIEPGVTLIVKPFTYAALATKIRQVVDSGA